MGAFQYDNPFMAALVKIANMMMVSFFWAVLCLPVVTIIPSCAALYHTTAKVIRGDGNGVVGDFFSSFRGALKKGIPLSLFCLLSGAGLAYAMVSGWRMQEQSTWGMLYFLLGCVISLVWAGTVLHLPAALARFEGGFMMYLRMGLYFAGKNVFFTLLRLLLLLVVILLVDFYPITLLILPGLYADLICGGIEKLLNQLMEEAGLSAPAGPEASEPAEASAAPAAPNLEMAVLYGEEDAHE